VETSSEFPNDSFDFSNKGRQLFALIPVSALNRRVDLSIFEQGPTTVGPPDVRFLIQTEDTTDQVTWKIQE
jgi:hypothetical protein